MSFEGESVWRLGLLEGAVHASPEKDRPAEEGLFPCGGCSFCSDDGPYDVDATFASREEDAGGCSTVSIELCSERDLEAESES